MDVHVLAKTNEEIRFVVEDINPQFANALRKIMISEVPVLAIDSVDFYANDSALYDEIVAHRLGLLPLKFDAKEFNLKEECKCEGKGCSSCQIVLVIDKKKPGMVYASDMKSADPELATPMFPETPIVELFGDQKLKAEATAVLGIGKNHAKFQAAKVIYRYFPEAKIEKKLENSEETVKSCPKKALTINDKANVSIDCDLCGECMKIAKPEGALKVTGNNSKFLFIVESISGLTAENILLMSIDILKKKIKDVEKEVGKIK